MHVAFINTSVHCAIEPKSWYGRKIVIRGWGGGSGRKLGLREMKSQLHLLFLLFNLKTKQLHTTEILWFTAGYQKSKILNDHVCSSDLHWEIIREIKTSNDEWFWGILHEKVGEIELEDWAKKEIGRNSYRNCLPCFIAVHRSGLHQRWFENKDKTNTKRNWQKRDIFI